MRNYPIFFVILAILQAACGVNSPLGVGSGHYTYCDTQNNICIQYPRDVFPRPADGKDKEDLILGLYSEKYDVRLLLSADRNAENLTFDQMYQQQMAKWKETYDDVDVNGSNITDSGYEVTAGGEDYKLYAKSSTYIPKGRVINLRLVAGPELTTIFFDDLKNKILIYPNK